MDISDLKNYAELSKTVVDLLKAAYSALPKGANRDEIEKKLTEAQELLKRSDAKLAESFHYKLCKCTFPPTIMLWDKDAKTNVCPACGDKNPPLVEPAEARFDRGTPGSRSRFGR